MSNGGSTASSRSRGKMTLMSSMPVPSAALGCAMSSTITVSVPASAARPPASPAPASLPVQVDDVVIDLVGADRTRSGAPGSCAEARASITSEADPQISVAAAANTLNAAGSLSSGSVRFVRR